MQAHLEYESLEKLHVPRPVDRLDYIAGCCVGRTVLDIGCFDETSAASTRPRWRSAVPSTGCMAGSWRRLSR